MKSTTLIPVLLGSFMMSSCIVVEPAREGATTSPSVSSEESDAGPAGWQAGYEKGMADGRGGLSRTPDRYGYIYSEADRSDFFRGYESGYNRGIQP
jgi:hypothetical protein